MKTKLLLLLIVTGCFTTMCKKDKNDVDEPASSLIVGKWITVAESYDYYDAQGRKIFSEPSSELDGPGTKVEFDNNGNVSIINGNDIERGKYKIFTANNKTYLQFLDSSELDQVEISFTDKTRMIWTARYTNETYRENGQQKTSVTSAYTVTLNKQ